MIFYRIYQIFIMLPLMLVVTFLASLACSVGCICGGSRFWGYYPAMIWGRCMAWLSLVRVQVRGRENVAKGQSYVFVANHQGAYDIFSIYGWLGHNFKWMMKKSLERIPMVGFACKKAGHIFVDKSSPRAIHETMQKAERQLAGGMSVVVFPEGSRTRNGKISRFKRGAFMLAEEFSLPVVPITIDGAYDVMPITAKVPRPGKIIVTIHKPITAPQGGYDIAALMQESQSVIASALPERSK